MEHHKECTPERCHENCEIAFQGEQELLARDEKEEDDFYNNQKKRNDKKKKT